MKRWIAFSLLYLAGHSFWAVAADTPCIVTAVSPAADADGTVTQLSCDPTHSLRVINNTLPSGSATSVNQATQITAEQSIQTNTANIPAKGAAATSQSTPVNIASDQIVPVRTMPSGTQITCSANGASTSNLVCTLAGTSGKTTYLNGFSITCQNEATTAVSTTATLAGIVTGTQTYEVNEPVGAFVPLTRMFAQPIPASATNTAIVVTLVGIAGGAGCGVNAEGFQL